MTDSTHREGGCACGAVRFRVAGPAKRAGLCHCMTCRKAHASAFNPFVIFDRSQVEVTGELSSWQSSPGYDRQFCARCGSRIWGANGGEVEISMGSFDEIGEFEPEYESWVIRREPWLTPLDVPHNDENRQPIP